MSDLLKIPEALPSKKELKKFVEIRVEEAIEGGMTDMAEAFVKAKFVNEMSKAILSNSKFKSAVLDEIDLDGGKEITKLGMKIMSANTPERLDFTTYSKYVEILERYDEKMAEADAIKRELAEVEELMKLVRKNSVESYDEEGIKIEKPIVGKPSERTLKAIF